MNKIETLFDTIGRVITSMGAVLFVMLMTISGMVFFSHTLFSGVFPAGMEIWERKASTWLMAIGWEATVLITTVNVKHVNKNIPAVMAFCSGLIVLFFIQAFDGTQELLTLVERWFAGVLAATINYIYADLFYAKWVERLSLIEQPAKLDQAQSTLDDLRAALDQARSEVNEARPKLVELNELRRFKAAIDRDLTCPHCKQPQSGYGTLQSHKGYCEQNPNRRKPKEIS